MLRNALLLRLRCKYNLLFQGKHKVARKILIPRRKLLSQVCDKDKRKDDNLCKPVENNGECNKIQENYVCLWRSNRTLTLYDVISSTKSDMQTILMFLITQPEFQSEICKHLGLINCPLKPIDYFLQPEFHHGPRNQWTCLLKLPWPEAVTFKDNGFTKRGAAKKVKLACLKWLQYNYPVRNICERVHTKSSCKNNITPLVISSSTNQNLSPNNIVTTREHLCLKGSIRNYCTQTDKAKVKLSEATVLSNITGNKEDVKSVVENERGKSDVEVQEKSNFNTGDVQAPEKSNCSATDVQHIHQLFPSPKNVLHNIFDILAKELNKRDLRLTPSYKLAQTKNSNTLWNCTYHLKWPEAKSFTEKACTKQEASKKSALSALHWLKSVNRITKDGQPIVYDTTVVKELKRSQIPVLEFNQYVCDKLNNIATEYKDNMLAYLVQTKGKENGEEAELTDSEGFQFRNVRQKYLGLTKYMAQEPTKLPISLYKKEFLELLKDNRVVIVKGEPGCGKSTRIPQYVLEQWATEGGILGENCRIAVTQPRRIAAISLAERVAYERQESGGEIVGYHVRLKSKFSHHTGRILYCTTGILLRHLQSDPSLKEFSHVILDEAHERDVNTDLLMNLLKKSMSLNPTLRVIVMSATIDTNIFKNYFDGAPVMHIPGFTHPVKSYFLDQCKSLDLSKTAKMCDTTCPSVVHEDVAKVIKYIHEMKGEGAILCFLPGWEDISKIRKMIPETGDLSVLCLHSRLQDAEQYKIFSRPPPGVRKIILATNIAETSVTIDDVVYVVDSGIHKEQRFDIQKGVNCIDNHWISQASMIQRKGRAGRVQSGECFHLYSKAASESCEKFTLPEILRTSLTKIILDSKVFSNNMNALEFMNQLLTPPEENAVIRAVEELQDLDLLDDEENLTSLGKTLADFQLEPKLSKAMVNSVIFKCVTPIVDIATLFSAETELFASGLLDKASVKNVKKQFSQSSDHLALMRLFEKWLDLSESTYSRDKFCRDTGLVPHKMGTIEKLRKIHLDYLFNGLYDVLPISDKYSDNDELVKAVMLSGVGNFLKYRDWDIVKGRCKAAKVFLTKRDHRASITQDSVNSGKYKFGSHVLIYINETRSNIRRTTIIRECSIVSPIVLLLFSNKDILVQEINEEENPDLVQVSLIGSNFSVKCDRELAKALVQCKEALFAGYKFYILLLTQGGEYHPKLNECWDKILSLLSDMLLEIKV